MKTASLELCEKLYELSGWKDTVMEWGEHGLQFVEGINNTANGFIPAYDLGYLLRKLPAMHPDTKAPLVLAQFPYTKQWGCDYAFNIGFDNAKIADTPEDAACKLAIELFKQGILTPLTIKEMRSK